MVKFAFSESITILRYPLEQFACVFLANNPNTYTYTTNVRRHRRERERKREIDRERRRERDEGALGIEVFFLRADFFLAYLHKRFEVISHV